MRELVQADQRTTPHRSALDFSFSFGCAVACAWLGERSEPTCIRQAHATVPKLLFFLYKGCFFFQTA